MVLKIAIKDYENLTNLDLDLIHVAQGDLKSLSKKNYRKLRSGIEDYGYCEPIVVWHGHDGIYWCADGTQRLMVLRAMRDDGWQIPKVPVILLDATDKADMMRKLSLLAGTYGKATQESVSDFAIANSLDFEFLDKYTALTDFDSPGDDLTQDKEPSEKAMIICPECGHSFNE